jgi:eukaryotic-like serine/threonine-protein kinase
LKSWVPATVQPGSGGPLLDLLCAEEPPLRSAVEELLAADAASGPLDLPPAIPEIPQLAESPEDPVAGLRIGPWRIEAELGRGGMGTVYLVERVDGQFRQRAALKRIRRGMDSEEGLLRFLAERQILARLEHPGIARLLDGGVSEDGRPFLVMELAPGIPLTGYCREKRLTPDERAQLFEQVCAAVEYAHRNLVVHRDLKPSNILVSSAGEVKLLDFGIAKLLDAEDAEGAEPGLTRAGAGPMTPEYAAPEQLRGEPVTTATDVYGLGAVLYELLTGQRPFSSGSASRSEVERAVLERLPEPPSAAARADEWLRRKLAGDLDTIVLTALRKEPERRYPSAEALRADLHRHRLGLPLLAHPDSFRYRARKFLGRNKLKAALAALSGLLLVAGLASTAWQMRAARAQAARAEAVKEFLLRLFDVSDPDVSKGKEVPARALLDQGAARIERELAGQPALRAEMLGVMGDLYRKLGRYDRAAPLLEQELGLQRRLHGNGGREVAGSLVRLAALRQDMGALREAEPLLREALRLHRDPGIEAARTQSAQARLLSAGGDFTQAAPLFEQALSTLAATAGPESADFADTLEAKAQMLLFEGRPAAAVPLLQRTLRIRRRLYGNLHTKVIQALSNLAVAHQESRDYATAADLLREVLALDRKLRGGSHPEVALDLTNLGSVLNRRGAYAQAEPALRQALALRRRFLGKDNPQLAVNYHNLAVAVAGQGRPAEAEALLRRAADLNRELVGDGHPRQAMLLTALGRVLAQQGKEGEAADLLDRAVVVLRSAGPAVETLLADALAVQGSLLLAAGHRAEAEPPLAEALAIQQRTLGPDDPQTRTTAERLAACLARSQGKTR